MVTEEVFCPRAFYPWVRGPYDENIDRLTGQFGIKINIPPTTAQNETIVITGDREGVHRAAAEIKTIVMSKQATTKEFPLTLPRAQHRNVIGHQRSGLHEILKATGVVVDVPPEESNSDIVILRGEMTVGACHRDGLHSCLQHPHHADQRSKLAPSIHNRIQGHHTPETGWEK